VADAPPFLIQEMLRLRGLIDDLNAGIYNPVGLNILWPRNVAFLYVCCPNFCWLCLIERMLLLLPCLLSSCPAPAPLAAANGVPGKCYFYLTARDRILCQYLFV